MFPNGAARLECGRDCGKVRALFGPARDMQLSFHTLDVFTSRKFGGNPLAVVHEADGLSGEDMQRIAGEFNLSETVFVLKAQSPAHTARIRIFTPKRELPFAGHPTIGAAVLLAELKAPSRVDSDMILALEEAIGTVRVGVRCRPTMAPFAEFDAPKLPAEAGGLPSIDRLAAGLGLIPSEIGFENHRPIAFSSPDTFACVPVSSLAAIAKARVNGHHWTAAFDDTRIAGIYLYTRQCSHTSSSFHARMFAPALGVPEDPATGAAAVGLAGAVHRFDELPDGTHKRVVEQGFEMNRPSFVVLTLTVSGGRLETVRIGGHAVRVSEGKLTL